MKIAVIGAGISGISTAWQLALDGHQVEVYERHSTPCEESSFATLGLATLAPLLPSFAPAIGSNRLNKLAAELKSLNGFNKYSLASLQWLWHRTRTDSLAHQRLLEHWSTLLQVSQDLTTDIQSQEQLEYESSQGVLICASLSPTMDRWLLQTEMLHKLGISAQVLSAGDIRQKEPALHEATPIQGGVWLPNDHISNSRQFAILLRNRAQERGALFHFNREVQDILRGKKLQVLCADGHTDNFDHVVVCTQDVPQFLRTVLPLPLRRLAGHSVTAAIKEPLNTPTHVVHDAETGISMARMGNRIRIQGGYHWDTKHPSATPKAVKQMYKTLDQFFPGACNYAQGSQTWRGVCLVTPDSLPVVGPSHMQGVSVNMAHGMAGWAGSQACAAILSDQISGRPPAEISTQLSPYRFA